MLFGGGENSIFSAEKITEMTEGFTSYTASTADADKEGKGFLVRSHYF